ncbi:hypothetical protein LZ30DRAFT_737013 [Colletotrichum cereale]|nr:hypothetical protein LZ30DRAFT_737013 [Colletotrichum cereale]
MNTAPVEIIKEIASNLTLVDLLNFSLADRRAWACSRRFVLQHVATLNTTSCLSEFEELLSSRNFPTRQLSIYHGTWPACARDDWETHPLQVADAHRSIFSTRGRRAASDEMARQAFDAYYSFIKEERLRNNEYDQAQLERVLSYLPRLEKITISSLIRKRLGRLGKAKLSGLRQKIRMSPTMFDSVGSLVESLFRVLPSFHQIHSVHIESKLLDFPPPCRLEGVRELEISALSLITPKLQSFVGFMKSFPNLERLSVAPYHPLGLVFPLADIYYPRLHSVVFSECWVSKVDFIDFVKRHTELKSLRLEGVLLSDCSWRPVLSALEKVQCTIELIDCK